MFEITPIRGNNQYAAAHYFSAADDYYTKEEPGIWQGQGAHNLGLTGAIDPAHFARLLAGQLPNGERIQTTFNHDKNKKRMGLDLTFSAPKSVSMQALIGGDQRVIEAHDRAVSHALQHIEKLAQTRKKIKGKSTRERTANLVIGKFRHELSRAKDPQLHTHAIVLNMTQRADGAWRALVNEDLFVVKHEMDAIYKTKLAQELQAINYQIRLVDDRGNFELAHISREQIEAFSARSRVIEEALANQGKTRATASALEKQVISLATRPRKEEGDRETIKQYWLEKSQELQINYHPDVLIDGHQYQVPDQTNLNSNSSAPPVQSLRLPIQLPAHLTPAQAVVQYALNHLTEREAVIGESVLFTTALRRAVGLADETEVREELKRLVKQGTLIEAVPKYRMAENKESPTHSIAEWQTYLKARKAWPDKQIKNYIHQAIKKGSLVQVEKRYTTQKALKREQVILAIERSGRQKIIPIFEMQTIKSRLDNISLTLGQREAVETILTTSHRFIGIQGDAGTGKTYSINQAISFINQANGYRVLALAPYGNQVKALKNEGMDAHTLASFLYTKNKAIDNNTVVILDEAAVVSARQMEQLMRIVEKADARMVFLGDTKQTEAIEAGKPFSQLQQAGMTTTRISEIQRQQDQELKKAVEYAAEGHTQTSLKHINHIVEIKEATQRHSAIVADYMQIAPKQRQETLIIAGTNEARKEINQLVRDSLKLNYTGRYFDTLTRVDMTQAQRRFAPSYKRDMVIQPERDYNKLGLIRGASYRIKEALANNTLRLEGPEGKSITINPRTITQLSVYQLERIEIAKGDIIRINRNDPKLDLTNGDRMRVVSILGDKVTLEALEQQGQCSQRTVELSSKKPLHLEYAYASTIHSAQGLSHERVLVALDTQSRTTSMNLYYVAISRAKQEARIYSDSIEKLPNAIARFFSKATALEIQREKQMNAKHNLSSLSRQPTLKKDEYEYGRF